MVDRLLECKEVVNAGLEREKRLHASLCASASTLHAVNCIYKKFLNFSCEVGYDQGKLYIKIIEFKEF